MSNESQGSGLSYIRHLTTLSAGAIVLQIGFLEKLFPHPQWKKLVVVSILSFTVSIVSGLFTQWYLMEMKNLGVTDRTLQRGGCFVMLLRWSFGVGLVSAVVFSLKNLSAI
jgi:hypothetical protein